MAKKKTTESTWEKRLNSSHYAKRHLACAMAVNGAYKGEGDIRHLKHNHGDLLIRKIETESHLLYAIPGTDEPGDWLVNLAVSLNDSGAHSGFDSLANRVSAGIANTVRACKKKGKKIIFAGHSLGGAVAVLAATQSAYQFPIDEVVTFGAPRVCSKEAAAKWRSQGLVPLSMLEYRYGVDPVPDVIPSSFALGSYTWLSKRSEREWLEKPSSKLTSGFRILRDPKTLLKHHSMATYVRELRKWS